MRKKTKPKSPFTGRWRIAWMDQWDQDFVDAEVEGFFEFRKDGSGEFQFGYVRGEIDYRSCTRAGKPCVEFTWDGNADEGLAKLKQYASWLQRDWPSAAASLHEGLEELFTINRLGLPSSLRRCLGTTNLIDNSHSALRERIHRVKHWQNGTMALRWTAAAFAAAEKSFRRIMGHQHLWILKAALDEHKKDKHLAEPMKAS